MKNFLKRHLGKLALAGVIASISGVAVAQIAGAQYLYTLLGSEKIRTSPNSSAYDAYTSTSRLMDGTIYTYNAPLTGATFAPLGPVGTLTLNPAGTIAAATVTMPPTLDDGKTFVLFTTATITALTLNTSNSATFTPAAPTTLTANSHYKFVYNLAGNTWYRIE